MSNDTIDHSTAKAEAKAAAALAKATRPWYAKKRTWALGVVVAGVISSQMGGGGEEPATATDTDSASAEAPAKVKKEAPAPAEPKATKVTAKEMLADFEANEAAADAKYKGQTLEITGIVEKVDTEWLDEDEYIVQMANGERFALWTVNANDMSAEEAATLTKGQEITIIGQFDDGGDLGVEISGSHLG